MTLISRITLTKAKLVKKKKIRNNTIGNLSLAAYGLNIGYTVHAQYTAVDEL